MGSSSGCRRVSREIDWGRVRVSGAAGAGMERVWRLLRRPQGAHSPQQPQERREERREESRSRSGGRGAKKKFSSGWRVGREGRERPRFHPRCSFARTHDRGQERDEEGGRQVVSVHGGILAQ